ncbi:hypothetical protein [Asanoa iriomotensis]|uniref:Uncharacterized protein n=1 Tax=Asanoa iriomotensis TaxID=234613 RepID=A0ABQ4BTS3_9ACTN|nr:hypothetical protein [Asanoa iriomotensis]GIF53930.1 hypothetical protein Air01nite_00250 [Asanoa iriomotensis]
MKLKVIEGALREAPNCDATGMDRRAFGEFVSQRGELASYAFGWITGIEPRVGSLTIGIGAGNPGGGTFHTKVFAHDDGLAYGLTDEVFEQVPEGGPHLTADEARAHDTLPFIWAVVDQVMARDRRAWWMAHWVLGTTCFQTPQVHAGREPILLVTHDADDGAWQLIGATDAGETATITHLYHAVDADPTLLDVLDLEAGQRATRRRAGAAWRR